ncbi:hypothetical protein DPMN_075831 [Dreissena polymorpha]|uniref:Uncharacterized protein n=1 Tax=Dreissena polymorpha TaxID=45954 RepID=A0A9D3YL55_DREPO|nr:hypothetical protein DPMN_075831 [Dreissena polymorpha]
MTDIDLFDSDSDTDGSSQLHAHSYIVISDSDETQPPSPVVQYPFLQSVQSTSELQESPVRVPELDSRILPVASSFPEPIQHSETNSWCCHSKSTNIA